MCTGTGMFLNVNWIILRVFLSLLADTRFDMPSFCPDVRNKNLTVYGNLQVPFLANICRVRYHLFNLQIVYFINYRYRDRLLIVDPVIYSEQYRSQYLYPIAQEIRHPYPRIRISLVACLSDLVRLTALHGSDGSF
jgi:hypothetical protein